MLSDKCKCGHTRMYHSVMGRCQHGASSVRTACPCIEFTATNSVHEFPVLPSSDECAKSLPGSRESSRVRGAFVSTQRFWVTVGARVCW
jgi:hypothetical protein